MRKFTRHQQRKSIQAPILVVTQVKEMTDCPSPISLSQSAYGPPYMLLSSPHPLTESRAERVTYIFQRQCWSNGFWTVLEYRKTRIHEYSDRGCIFILYTSIESFVLELSSNSTESSGTLYGEATIQSPLSNRVAWEMICKPNRRHFRPKD